MSNLVELCKVYDDVICSFNPYSGYLQVTLKKGSRVQEHAINLSGGGENVDSELGRILRQGTQVKGLAKPEKPRAFVQSMPVIYKYPICSHGETNLVISPKTQFLHIGKDPVEDGLRVWVETDPNSERIPATLYVVYTGEQVPEGEYIGSCCIGHFMYHAYVKR
jgi:hypothetical protein